MSNSARKTTKNQQKPLSQRTPSSNSTTEAVDPVWLIKAFGLVVLAALICGYLTLCLLFYQGQWQLVLHPSRTGTAPATLGEAPVQAIHFGTDESATPQLTGWWIPAEPFGRYADYTLLYLPGGEGSLADARPTLAVLHSLGINLFAFDYRGYGQSAAIHPNQRRMTQDANSAWHYLAVARAIPVSRLVLYGEGVGGFLAAQLAAEHPEVRAIVLDSPQPDPLGAVLADPRMKSLPVRLLFRERFDISKAVKTLRTPKLFLLNDTSSRPGKLQSASAAFPEMRSLLNDAASPKMIAHLAPADRADTVGSGQVTRFLDEYLR